MIVGGSNPSWGALNLKFLIKYTLGGGIGRPDCLRSNCEVTVACGFDSRPGDLDNLVVQLIGIYV